MFTLPASKVFVPITVVSLILSRVADKDFDPVVKIIGRLEYHPTPPKAVHVLVAESNNVSVTEPLKLADALIEFKTKPAVDTTISALVFKYAEFETYPVVSTPPESPS